VEGTGLVANQLNLVSAAATTTAGQGFSEQTSLGFYVQEQVGYQDKLYVTAAVRVDDNSAFGQDFSLVVYPKASVTYVVSDEDWFDLVWVDQLKVRAAWGQAGIAPAPFSADRTFGTGTTSFEIIGGAFYEPILAMISSRDRVGQIQSYTRWLEDRLGATVRGMWVPERVWEQSFTRDLADAAIEYTVLDDFHFKNAGLTESQLFGRYLTEDDGRVLSVFPGSEQLRYWIPFADPQETINTELNEIDWD
jgi:hypothetical protein